MIDSKNRECAKKKCFCVLQAFMVPNAKTIEEKWWKFVHWLGVKWKKFKKENKIVPISKKNRTQKYKKKLS